MLSLLFFFRDIYTLLYRVMNEEENRMNKEDFKAIVKAIIVTILIIGILGSCLIAGSVWAFLAWLF